jgi:hypothetical protein
MKRYTRSRGVRSLESSRSTYAIRALQKMSDVALSDGAQVELHGVRHRVHHRRV